MRDIIIKKLKDRSGMSFSELLVAMLILLLVSSGMVNAIQQASVQFVKSRMQSEAKMLCSTLTTVCEDELRYASSIVTVMEDGKTVYYFISKNHANEKSRSTFSVADDTETKKTFTVNDETESADYGIVTLYYPDAESTDEKEVKILPDGSYPLDLKARVEILGYESFMFHVRLVIVSSDGAVLADEDFYVENLNKAAVDYGGS